jgi:hypothetical protein
MATRDADDGQIQFKRMGGLNERPAPHALDAPDFGVLHALYQRHAGALSRLEGTNALALLPQGVGVLGGAQLDDGTGNVVVQGDNGTEYLFTLDELFGRSPTNTLVYEPLDDDADMPTATLVQTATNGTDLASIGGASANTFYQRPLTANPLNEDSIVVAFASNQFTIAPGTYRIRGWVTCGATLAVTGGSSASVAQVGFQFAVNDTTNSATKATSFPAKFQFERSAVAGGYTVGPINLVAFIDDTFTIAGGNAVLEIQNAFSSSATGVSVNTITGGTAADVSATLNGAALTQYYVMLNLSKTA